MWRRIFSVLAGMLAVGLIVSGTAVLSMILTNRQIRMAFDQMSPSNAEYLSRATDNGTNGQDNLESLDFFRAVDIQNPELSNWLETLQREQSLQQVRVIMTLQDSNGRYLVDGPVQVAWDSGSEWINVGNSGLVEFALSEKMLTNLTLRVPSRFTQVRQRTFPMGSRYEPVPEPETPPGQESFISDDEIQQHLVRHLRKVRSSSPVRERLDAEAGLQRTRYAVELEDSAAAEQRVSPEQIYQTAKGSVVVVGFLKPNGEISQGTGFVIHEAGWIVTNYHVADKPDALACGILTSDLRFAEVQQITAGNAADDLALLKVDGLDLPPLVLATVDAPVAAEAFAVSHPNSNYFSLTHGRITRYFRQTRHALPSIRMGVTAEYAQGSSGGPLLDPSGRVIGVLSATHGDSGQMIHREAIPVSSLRKLLNASVGNDPSQTGSFIHASNSENTNSRSGSNSSVWRADRKI